MSEAEKQASDKSLADELNNVLLNVYDLSIANAPVSPPDCRKIADSIGANVGRCRASLSALQAERDQLREAIRVAAVGIHETSHLIDGLSGQPDPYTAAHQLRMIRNELHAEIKDWLAATKNQAEETR